MIDPIMNHRNPRFATPVAMPNRDSAPNTVHREYMVSSFRSRKRWVYIEQVIPDVLVKLIIFARTEYSFLDAMVHSKAAHSKR